MNIVKIFLFSSLVFLLPLTSHSDKLRDSIDCDKLYKEKGFYCINEGIDNEVKWKGLKFDYYLGNNKIEVYIENESSKTYRILELLFGVYDENFELLAEYETYYENSMPKSSLFTSTNTRIPSEVLSEIKYIKLHGVKHSSGNTLYDKLPLDKDGNVDHKKIPVDKSGTYILD